MQDRLLGRCLLLLYRPMQGAHNMWRNDIRSPRDEKVFRDHIVMNEKKLSRLVAVFAHSDCAKPAVSASKRQRVEYWLNNQANFHWTTSMRNTADRRATYHQSLQKQLAQADNVLAAEAVRLQAEAVATVTDWSEYRDLASEAIDKEKQLDTHERGRSSRIPPADISDVNHE